MIAPEVGIGTGSSVREVIERYNEPFLRERRQDEAYVELCAMSSDGDRAVGAASAAPIARSLGSSNCHISPKDRYKSPLEAWAHSSPVEALNWKEHVEYIGAKVARDQKRRVRLHYEGTLIRIDGVPGWEEYDNEKKAKRGAVSGFSCKARSRM